MDLLRRIAGIDYPLTHEAALFLTRLTPCDGKPVCRAFGFRLRPTAETLRDAIRWLVEVGELDAALAGDVVAPA